MTAITSLESVHKKGIFGDHQKKVSKELLQVSEIKKLTIVQVVHYKKSIKPCLRKDIIKNLNFKIAKDASMNLSVLKRIKKK